MTSARVNEETEVMDSVGGAYQTEVSDTAEALEWDAFLKATPGGSYQQSSSWARVKGFTGLKTSRIVIRQDGAIVAGAQILRRSFGPIGAVGYLTRGPVVSQDHLGLDDLIIQEIRVLARKRGIHCLAVQAAPGNAGAAAKVSEWEGCPDGLSLAPVASLLLDLTPDLESILGGMRKTTRYDIRASGKKGVAVRLGTEDDLEVFHRLARMTGERQGFATEPLKYYRNLWRAMAPKQEVKLFMAEVEGEPVSGAMMMVFGDTMTFWRSGWSGAFAGHHPNEAVQWASIHWAKEQGCRVYDLGGIGPRTAALLQRGEALPDAPEYRAYLFKIGFGGQVAVFPRTTLYVHNPLVRRIYRAVWQRHNSIPVMNRVIKIFS